jgi:hypothetical protein
MLHGSFLANALAIGAQNNTNKLYSKLVEIDEKSNEESGILQLIWIEGEFGGGAYSGQNDEYMKEFKYDTKGITAGFPLWRGKNDIGLYAGYAKKEIEQGADKGEIDDIEGGIYIGHYDTITLKGNIAIGMSKINTQRNIEFSGYKESAYGEFSAMNIRFGGEAEYRIQIDEEAQAKPFIGIKGAIVSNNDINEEGGKSANLSVAEDKYTRADALVGLKIEDAKGLFHWNIRGYGGYIITGEKPTYKISWTNIADSEMDIEGIELSRLYGGLSAWIEDRLARDISIFSNIDFNYGTDNINYYGNIGFKYHINGKVSDIREIKQANKEKKEGIKVGKESKITVAACEFGLGEYELDELAKTRINRLASEIKRLKYTQIRVVVNLDIADYIEQDTRYELANLRARAVYAELYKNGVDIDKMEYEVQDAIMLDGNEDFADNRVDVEIDYLRY